MADRTNSFQNKQKYSTISVPVKIDKPYYYSVSDNKHQGQGGGLSHQMEIQSYLSNHELILQKSTIQKENQLKAKPQKSKPKSSLQPQIGMTSLSQVRNHHLADRSTTSKQSRTTCTSQQRSRPNSR